MKAIYTAAALLALAAAPACSRDGAKHNAAGNGSATAAYKTEAPAAQPAASPTSAAAEAEVRALLDRIYAPYASDNGDSVAWADAFEPKLAAAIGDEEGEPGADPFIDGQDYSPFRPTYEGIQIDGDRALAVARFTLFGEPRRMEYQLVRTPAGWRVHDIRSGTGSVRERHLGAG